MIAEYLERAWAEAELGIRVRGAAGAPGGLVSVALRRNPLRLQLLVSTVLGKHIPVTPSVVRARGAELGALVAARLGAGPPGSVIVIGFAETATSLAFVVAHHLGASYLHTTRDARAATIAELREEHSHAPVHLLAPESADALHDADVVVIVDDEFSTGLTAAALIDRLGALTRAQRFVLAALVDSRPATSRDAAGAPESVALAELDVEVPADARTRATSWIEAGISVTETTATGPRAALTAVSAPWDPGVPLELQNGATEAELPRVAAAAERVADVVAAALGAPGPRIVVLGVEEFMTVPLLVAEALERRGYPVLSGATTRSPVVALDVDGYPIRHAIEFGTLAGERFVYNVAAASFDLAVVVAPAGAELGGLPDALRAEGVDVMTVAVGEEA